jgi:hypothetical protein
MSPVNLGGSACANNEFGILYKIDGLRCCLEAAIVEQEQ